MVTDWISNYLVEILQETWFRLLCVVHIWVHNLTRYILGCVPGYISGCKTGYIPGYIPLILHNPMKWHQLYYSSLYLTTNFLRFRYHTSGSKTGAVQNPDIKSVLQLIKKQQHCSHFPTMQGWFYVQPTIFLAVLTPELFRNDNKRTLRLVHN